MDICQKTLDKIFIPYFDSIESGKTVSIVELNWFYDYKNRCGGLTNEELEYVINRQIELGQIKVLSESEFAKTPTPENHPSYLVDASVTKKAQKQYSKEFRDKLRKINT